MIWFFQLLIVLLTGVAGLLCGGWLAHQWVDWFRISSFEGGSGYFMVGIALAGALVAICMAVLILALLRPREASELWIALGSTLSAVLGSGGLLLLVSRWTADLPPRLEGRELLLEVELQFPAGTMVPDLPQSRIELHALRGRSVRASRPGRLLPDRLRQEDGRWILPAEVPLYSERGDRLLAWTFPDRSVGGFKLPLPARPGAEFLDWSAWLPRPPGASWPADRARYRFRLRRVPEASRSDAE